MKIKVLFFAFYREIAGRNSIIFEVRKGAKLKDIEPTLYSRFPALKKHTPNIIFTLNNTYPKRDAPLKDSDVIAIIPPVSGG